MTKVAAKVTLGAHIINRCSSVYLCLVFHSAAEKRVGRRCVNVSHLGIIYKVKIGRSEALD